MSLDTFRAAIQLDGTITLGGGEPTLHKHFDTMVLESLGAVHDFHGDGCVTVITNGSRTTRALVLAQLSKGGIVDAQLSQDEYHDAIDQRVIDAFHSIKPAGRYNTGIRNTTEHGDPYPHGRAIELLDLDDDELADQRRDADGSDCICSDFVVKPNGDIVQCGCTNSPIVGNAQDGVDIPFESYGECCHSMTFQRACIEEEDGKYEHLLG
jgi:hypothetical protein